ncbi:MAG: PD40 domain-containing protein [Phycisphaerales bacterium]|nr:MAG: PD40 domain-containing protein [Phycisphaerales bacterium]
MLMRALGIVSFTAMFWEWCGPASAGNASEEIHQITNHPAADYQPRWSPNGPNSAFVSSRIGGGEIQMM